MTPEDQIALAKMDHKTNEKCQQIFDLVSKYYCGDDVQIHYWFEVPHPSFDNWPPKQYMVHQSADRVLKFVENNMKRINH